MGNPPKLDFHEANSSRDVNFALVGFCGIHLRAISQANILYNEFENCTFKRIATSPMGQRFLVVTWI